MSPGKVQGDERLDDEVVACVLVLGTCSESDGVNPWPQQVQTQLSWVGCDLPYFPSQHKVASSKSKEINEIRMCFLLKRKLPLQYYFYYNLLGKKEKGTLCNQQ